MFGPKVKLDKELFEKLRACAEKAGYASVDEFIRHTLEKAADQIDSGQDDDQEEVKRRLEGLGYIS